MRSFSDFRPAQRWGTETLKCPWAINPAERIPGVILAWDMGAGKTGTCLKAVRDLLDQFVIRKVLIVAGLLVAQVTWPDEFEEWDFAVPITRTLIRAEDWDEEIIEARKTAYRAAREEGHSAKAAEKIADRAIPAAKDALRARLASEDTEVHIINREALPWLFKFHREGKAWPYDLMIVDDARETKSGVQRVRRAKDEKKGAPLSRFGIMARVRKKMKATVLLTGTPAPNGFINLWGQGYLVDLGQRLGTARTAFEQRWFKYDQYKFTYTPTESAPREITERLQDIMFSLGKEDYPQVEIVYNSVKVRLSPKVLAEYKKFERTLVSDVYDVEAVNSGVLANKLLQFANGSMYQEDGNDIHIHDEKLEALETIIAEAAGAPVLVAYSYKFDLGRIRKRFPKAIVFNEGDARKTAAKWNEGEIPLLLGHPASMGHGLNLQYGGNIAVWYGLTSDLELYLQFNKRLARPGQAKPVFLHHIVAENTHDEDMLPRLQEKAATQDYVLESTRCRLINL